MKMKNLTSHITETNFPFDLVERQHLTSQHWTDLASSVDSNWPNGLSVYPDLLHAELKNKYIRVLSLIENSFSFGTDLTAKLNDTNIVFTRGVTEAIDLVIRTLIISNSEAVLIPTPTFGLYEYWSKLARINIQRINLHGSQLNSFDLNELFLRLNRDNSIKILFICRPNNPLGTLMAKDDILRILEDYKSFVVIDEAYMEYSDQSSLLELVSQYENLVVMRSLSKAYGLAGARVGAIFAQPALIENIKKVQGPYATSTLVQESLAERLGQADQILEKIRSTKVLRAQVIENLRQLKVVDTVWKSQSNFIQVQFNDFDTVIKELNKSRIIVENYNALIPKSLRISITNKGELNRLLNILSDLSS